MYIKRSDSNKILILCNALRLSERERERVLYNSMFKDLSLWL